MYEAYQAVEIPEMDEPLGTGWLPPLPDLRDYTVAQPGIATMSKTMGVAEGGKKLKAAPTSVDLRAWCSPIENQKSLGSCTANAAVGVVEYFQRRAFGKHINGSRLFVYKTTRNLMQVAGDTGAWLRNTMGALVLCGVPPEKYWPYTDATPAFDKEPSSFVYSVGDDFQAVQYFSHDPLGANVPTATVLTSVKNYLAAGIPSMFGFWGFPSFDSCNVKGGIPLPVPRRAGAVGARHRRGRLRRRQEDQEHAVQQDDHRRPPHPQLVGHGVGRRGLRMDALRLRPRPAGPRLLVAAEPGLGRHERFQVRAAVTEMSASGERRWPAGGTWTVPGLLRHEARTG
jgi:hypothetical protein